jgi:MinD-like ATPase involved in chromosome partitioning or flagellar assembly
MTKERLIIASGMQGTGVSTVVAAMQSATSVFDVIDAGAQWSRIREACTVRFTRLIAVTTDDIVAITSTYALIKLIREHFPDAPIEVLVNWSDERNAIKTYERIQHAATHFLRETVSYAGSIPYDETLGTAVTNAIQNLVIRLEELSNFDQRYSGRNES